MALLDVVELSSGYGKLPVLHNINFNVLAGSLTGVVGPNGAGKTTLMGTILGVVKPMGGSIFFDGHKIDHLEPEAIVGKGIGYVPQRDNVFPDLTVRENLEIGAILVENAQERINEVIGSFPALKDRQKQRAGTLSGGERQMLAIASALILTPKMLLLDEPTTGLAPLIREQLINIILGIKEAGTTLVWVVEEEPHQVLPHADEVYLMESGVIKLKSTGKALLADPNFDELFLGKANNNL